MIYRKAGKILLLLLLLLLAVSLASTGCSSWIGQGQRKAALNFSKAAKGESLSPGPLWVKIAEQEWDHAIIGAARKGNVSAIQQDLETAAELRHGLLSKAAEVDNALTVLTKYPEVLGILAGDEFVAEVTPAAEEFGKNFEAVVTNFQSSASQADNGPLVNMVTGIVKAIGEYKVRIDQKTYIRQAVYNAQPAVHELVMDIVTGIDELDSEFRSLDLKSKNSIELLLIGPNAPSLPLGPHERELLNELGTKIYEVNSLRVAAKEIRRAAVAYDMAHRDLVKSMESGSELSLEHLSDFVNAVEYFKGILSALE